MLDFVDPCPKQEVPCFLPGLLNKIHECIIAICRHRQHGAVFLGVLECFNQIIRHTDEIVLEGKLPGNKAVPCCFCPRRKSVALLDCHHIRLNPTAEKATVILPRFHHHGKIGKLRRTIVDVQSIEIVLQNRSRCLTSRISIVLVNPHKHVKHIAKNMSTPHAGIDAANILRLELGVFFSHLGKLFLDRLFLLGFGEIVFPLALQTFVRMAFEPQAA